DLDVLKTEFGHIDVHMLQYSGAIWYPWVYDMPQRAKEAFGTQKRQRQMDRARSYVDQVGATWVVPSAGPPMFLDDDLRYLNDDAGEPSNIFPDQKVFLAELAANGNDGGLLMIPGTTGDFAGTELKSLTHPLPEPEVDAIFDDKARYIEAMAQKKAPIIAAQRTTWAQAEGAPLFDDLKAKFEPIMVQSDQICDGIGYPVLLELTVPGGETENVVLDFPARTVRGGAEGEKKFRYGFTSDRGLGRTVIRDDEPDWVNTICLSTRFTTWRVGGSLATRSTTGGVGGYNAYRGTFSKCLTDASFAYADGWFAEAHGGTATIELDGRSMLGSSPHLKPDLTKFGVVEGTTLTCNL